MDMFRQKSPAEQLRDNKRMIDRAIRDLDRERVRLEQQEKKTLGEMKRMARLGQQVFFLCLSTDTHNNNRKRAK